MKSVVLAAILLGSVGCFLNACGDDQHDTSGPGIDVHCAAQTPRPGVGDTSVKVTCPPTS